MKLRNIIFAIICATATTIHAQDNTSYSPTTNWPYLNPTFEQGTIHLVGGTHSNAVMNIHLHDGVLQCIGANDIISRVTFTGITSIIIGEKTYLNINDTFMQQLATNNDSTAMLLLHSIPDWDELLRSNSSYYMNMGAISSAKIQELNLKGRNNERHNDMRAVWYDGKPISLKHKFYIYNNGELTQITRKNILALCNSPEKKREMKMFIKKNKIKLDNNADCIRLFKKIEIR